jgi:hypothetical protein
VLKGKKIKDVDNLKEMEKQFMNKNIEDTKERLKVENDGLRENSSIIVTQSTKQRER